MNPLTLHARNYRSFESLDVDLPTGCIAIIGPNGAGKSTLVNGIPVAIFGSEGRSLADEQTDFALDDLLLELEVEHAGRLYRIRRTFSSRGRGKPTCDFERLDSYVDIIGPEGGPTVEEWVPLTAASITATDELIVQTFGLSRTTFLASAFLAQGRGALFCDASPRDRLRILSEIIGLDRWDTALQAVRGDKQGLERRQVELATRARQAEEVAAGKPQLERERADVAEAETVSADNVADLERSRAELLEEHRVASEHRSRTAAARAELLRAQAVLAGIDASLRKAAEATQTISVASDELAGLPEYPPLDEIRAREAVLVAAVEAHAQAVREREAALEQLKRADRERTDLGNRADAMGDQGRQLVAKANHLEEHDEPRPCDRCGQDLSGEARDRAIKSYRDEAIALDESAILLRAEALAIEVPVIPALPADEPPTHELAVCRSALTAAASSNALRATLAERIAACERTLDEQPTDDQVAAARAAVDEKDMALAEVGEPPNLAAIELRGNEVSQELARARAALDEYRQQRARLEERLMIAAAAEATLAEHAAERRTLDDALDDVLTLERAFAPNGVPALILENTAIPYIEVEAQKVLARLGGKTATARLELRTQRARKSGDGVMDALDVVVTTEQGGEREYHNWSGGEQMRIDFALRYALAKLLYSRGADSGVFVIDEPEGLDRDGKAALIELLREMEGEGVGRVYLISHDADLAESFDQTIVVAADGASSRIDGAGVAEAAAA